MEHTEILGGVDTEQGQSRFEIAKAESADNLVDILIPNKARGDNELQQRVRSLYKLSKQAGSEVFVVDTEHGRWNVVANALDKVRAAQDSISNIARFQSRIEPEGLWGCVHSHTSMQRLLVFQTGI